MTEITTQTQVSCDEGKPESVVYLTSVVSARICHDLVSPVGAIVNFVDLIREVGTGDISEELRMITQSAERASSLLQFHRIAFGSANKETSVDRTALREQSMPIISSPKVMVLWTGEAGPAVSATEARLICLLLLCARGLAGMRGLIRVGFSPAGLVGMSLTIEAEGARQSDDMIAQLLGTAPISAASPRIAEFALARLTSAELGLSLHLDETPERRLITVSS